MQLLVKRVEHVYVGQRLVKPAPLSVQGVDPGELAPDSGKQRKSWTPYTQLGVVRSYYSA